MITAEDMVALEDLLEQLRVARGFDFGGYKRTSLARRIRRRMQALSIPDFPAYGHYLDGTPEEYGVLFNTILINVTGFFRDPEAWQYLREEVVPRLVRESATRPQLRVWSAGCASGEEPYTIAMLLAEAMGVEDYCKRVKVYATDWDDDALSQARRARYSVEQIAAVPPDLRARYFSLEGNTATFDGTLRRTVIFGRHDLTEDPPISKLDLLLCRNTLMYFTIAAQARVLARLHFALGERGFLFLGRAEMLLSHSRYFTPLQLKHRVFVKVAGVPLPPTHHADPEEAPMNRSSDRPLQRLRDAVMDAGPVAQVVLDADDRLALFNTRAATLFLLGTPEIGKRLQDLEISYRPADLRTMLDAAREQRGPASTEVSRSLPSGDVQFFEVTLAPLFEGAQSIGTTITFDDVTRHHRLQENLQQFSENLETAYEELQSANEELETTNEELQSSNEELETTNEELQAANEEMETINEELRSTNEELQTANEQLRVREDELDSANGFLQAILGSLRSGVAVVDRDLHIQVWNARAEELWGVRADEVKGTVLTSLDIGLPVASLAVPLEAAMRSGEVGHIELDAINRRGRPLRCRITISPLRGSAPSAATLLMDTIGEGAEP
ncbi:MAG TPA: CheR family methyltransferase [Nannocystaceae bacterium]|nr:CheR family methyltransferase [Nannocystaceae bacterium]